MVTPNVARTKALKSVKQRLINIQDELSRFHHKINAEINGMVFEIDKTIENTKNTKSIKD